MKNRKRFFPLLTLALLILALLSGCGSSRVRKLRDTDVIIDYGMVTRGGEQTIVFAVCDQKAIYFYCDDEEHELFDKAMLPTEELYDREVWNEDWKLGAIDFSDVTDDNNSDLQATLFHSDMSESHIAWKWEEGEGYVYQPEDSTFYHSIVFRYPDEGPEKPEEPEHDFSMYEGLWKGDAGAGSKYDCDEAYLEFDAYGCWKLYSGGDSIDAGFLQYEPDWDATYIYCYQGGTIGGSINGSCVEPEGDWLSISNCGRFSREDARTYHLASSVLQGTWYLDNDRSAKSYIVIDGYGNWSCYRRTLGDPEAARTDYGTFSCSVDEPSIYYADSAMYDGVRHRVFEFDEGILIWGEEATYYRLEE